LDTNNLSFILLLNLLMSSISMIERLRARYIEEVNVTCSICLEDVVKRGSCVLGCGHEFHLKCFMELQVNGGVNRKNCPNCRAEQDLPDLVPIVEEPSFNGNLDVILNLLRGDMDRIRGQAAPLRQVQVPPRQARGRFVNSRYQRGSTAYWIDLHTRACDEWHSVVDFNNILIDNDCNVQLQTIRSALNRMVSNNILESVWRNGNLRWRRVVS
jgi:hypothetical protein